MDYQIYYSLKGKKKTYIVAPNADTYALGKFARHYFHCSAYDVQICMGYIYDGLLYLDNPHKKKQKTVLIASYSKYPLV